MTVDGEKLTDQELIDRPLVATDLLYLVNPEGSKNVVFSDFVVFTETLT